MEERLVLEDDLRGSRDFLAIDLDLSKGKVRFSVKCEVHTESNRYIINAHKLFPKCTSEFLYGLRVLFTNPKCNFLEKVAFYI